MAKTDEQKVKEIDAKIKQRFPEFAAMNVNFSFISKILLNRTEELSDFSTDVTAIKNSVE